MSLPLIPDGVFRWIERGMIVGVCCIVFAAYLEHRSPPVSAKMEIAHAATVQAEQVAAKQDTVYLTKKVAAAKAETTYVALHDSVLSHLTDTVLVKETIRHADTVIVEKNVAIAAADSDIAAHKKTEADLHTELSLALERPRLSSSVAALYDPIASTPAVSGSGSFRLFSGLSVGIRGDQRFAPAEKPHGYLVVSIAF